jgi:hypothetical protein
MNLVWWSLAAFVVVAGGYGVALVYNLSQLCPCTASFGG